ncbi:MAG: DNA mismatch repair protein MutS, partial [Salinibacterium sp.]|nr:DNA mismatch repair protein MutS [Salinibacterium sp.]
MTTPMMKQWHSVKDRHREGIVFFRMGDFFEFFHEDAKVASRLLGLTLTARSKGDRAIPMAGIPVRQVESYVARLVDLGQKVVICDQVEDPATATGIVDRDVTRIVTPGTVVDPGSLDDKDNNYLLALGPRKGSWGMAWVDLSTGEFAVREVEESRLDQTLQGFDAAEILLPEGRAEDHALVARCRAALGCPVTWRPDFRFDQEAASRALNRHFGTLRLSGFGIEEETFPLGAAGAVLDYLEETQRGAIGQVRSLRRVQDGRTMAMDRSTRASLELVRTLRDADRKGSLLGVMDRTVTAMGARLLKSWILEPLLDADAIRDRQGAVSELVDAPGSLQSLREALDQVLDVERLAGRVGSGRVNARDLAAIAQSIASLPRVIASLGDTSSPWLRDRIRGLPDLDDLQHRLASTLVDAPPMSITEGGIIAEGHDPELDEMRRLGREGKGFIASFQARESEATGIANLKIGFNRVFGYYIEISNGQRDKVPERYHRKQTLKNAERYIT